MTASMPTRITIEVHPPQAPGEGWTARTDAEGATVHVTPAGEAVSSRASVTAPMAGEPREDVPAPAAYQPGECLCLDEAECGRDHANE